VINNAIARRYAKALVQLGSEKNQIEQFSTELKHVDALFASDSGLQAVFGNPAFTAQQKKEIMKGLIARLGCKELISNFLMLLVDKNRVSLLSHIIDIYGKLADEHSGVLRAEVTSAFELDAQQVSSIQDALKKKTGKKVVININVDKALIGGVITQIGDIAYDSSVKTQLARINDILQKG